MDKPDRARVMGQSTAWLCVAEMGVGAWAHSLHLPLTGQVLSLNQNHVLIRCGQRLCSGTRVAVDLWWVSVMCAILKSLAPAGKKLTPMLAISCQGALLALGVALLGTNVAGFVMGAVLASTWAFIQPLLLAWVFFGAEWKSVGELLLAKFAELPKFWTSISIEWVGIWIGGWMLFKAIVAAALAYKAARGAGSDQSFLETPPAPRIPSSGLKIDDARTSRRGSLAAWGALKDLGSSKMFWISLALTAVFFVWVEAPFNQWIWLALRPAAIAFVLFFLFRAFPWEATLLKMRGGPLDVQARAFEQALAYLRRWEQRREDSKNAP